MAFRMIKNIFANLRQVRDRDVWEIADSGAPSNGTSGTGAGFAGPGSSYVNTANGAKYLNTGTKASPTWSLLATSAVATQNVVASGTNTSGATTAVSIAVSGALTTDIPIVTWRVAPQTLAHVVATATTDAISVTFGATVGTAGTLNYALVRPA